MTVYGKTYDIIVVGAGHAGCEAALAPARMGLAVLLLAIDLDKVENVCTKGRINQSVSQWCFGKWWSLDELGANCAKIGIKGIDLIGANEWPAAKKHGLVPTMATVTPALSPMTVQSVRFLTLETWAGISEMTRPRFMTTNRSPVSTSAG